MPKWTETEDLTTNNLPNFGGSGKQAYRPANAVNNYPPGTVLQLVAIDKELYPDFQTVQPMPAGATLNKFVGVVADDWPGFTGSIVPVPPPPLGANAPIPAQFISTLQTNVRGTQFINAVIKGAAYVLVNAASGVTITDGIPLVSSANTAGFAQGIAVGSAPGALGSVGVANLPSTGIGSSLTSAALAQASQFSTVATPAAGDTLNLTIQSQYTDLNPGTVQTTTWSLTLTATTAASATTAAAAMVAYLNSQPSYSQYFTASNVAGALTTTVNALSNPFLVTFGASTSTGALIEVGRFYTFISGMVSNTLTYASSVTGSGGTTFVANGANLAGGTGFFGKVPALITGEF